MQSPLLKIAAIWLSTQEKAGIAANSRKLTSTYRDGKSTAHGRVDLQAYVAARLPATYAAVSAVMEETSRLMPQLKLRSMLDLGAGPGTASWAAVSRWPWISQIDMIDQYEPLAKLAREFCKESELAVLTTAIYHLSNMAHGPLPGQADLVVAAYSFTELNEAQFRSALELAWQVTQQALIIVEPGTPAGFSRIGVARRWLLDNHAYVVAPCPHDHGCPMVNPDWCHFSVRLARNRLHMQAKQASVPFEDEKFSYLAVTRQAPNQRPARILAPPRRTKPAVELRLCTVDGLARRSIASRDKAVFKAARKLAWGDGFYPSMENGEENDT